MCAYPKRNAPDSGTKFETRGGFPDGSASFDPIRGKVVTAADRRSVIDDDSLPDGWDRDRRLEAATADLDREPSYVGFLHADGDVRVRIVPPETGRTDDYEVRATAFPATELSQTWSVRTLATRLGAVEVAIAAMKLIDGALDGPRAVEEAIEYALARVRPADVPDNDALPDDVGP